MSNIQFHTMPDGRRIAYRFHASIADTETGTEKGTETGIEADTEVGAAAAHSHPALVFLPGYMSDMDGGKAGAVMGWAQANGRECLLMDYSGCGFSEGAFSDGTLTRWREEVLALITALELRSVILIGSSMGGWLMLLAGLDLEEKLSGIIGIASAPDFTEWGRSAEDQRKLARGETVYDPNPYGPDPTPMFAEFWRDGQAQKQLEGQIALDCSVRLIHGQNDADVPWRITMKLAEKLRSSDVQIHLIKDGNHRLSRDSDIALLCRVIAGFCA